MRKNKFQNNKNYAHQVVIYLWNTRTCGTHDPITVGIPVPMTNPIDTHPQHLYICSNIHYALTIVYSDFYKPLEHLYTASQFMSNWFTL